MLPDIILNFLEGYKAQDIQCLDIASMTPFIDKMIVCTSNSTTHAQSLAESLLQLLKTENFLTANKIEGTAASGWILVSVGFLVVHIMSRESRELYQIEKLWNIPKISEVEESV